MPIDGRKRLLVLGGAAKALPLVRAAQARGDAVVLCDYDPQNPCRDQADEFVEVSVLDREAVLEVARNRKVSGVVSFGSDVIAVVAAWVAEQLGLPGNPSRAVETMVRKDRFRSFLSENGFASPASRSACEFGGIDWPVCGLRLPVMVKPVDGAGSTAVIRVNDWSEMPAAFETAKAASRARQVVIEEYIERCHPNMIAGDIFVDGGEIIYWGLLDSHRAATGMPFLPTGTSFPMAQTGDAIDRVRRHLSALVKALGLRIGPVNVELMFGADGELYTIELAPRNGGNQIPQLLETAQGGDMIAALADVSMGRTATLRTEPCGRCITNYMIHSSVAGKFEGLYVAPRIEPFVTSVELDIAAGGDVPVFDRAPHALGTLWLEFPDQATQQSLAARLPELVSVCLESG